MVGGVDVRHCDVNCPFPLPYTFPVCLPMLLTTTAACLYTALPYLLRHAECIPKLWVNIERRLPPLLSRGGSNPVMTCMENSLPILSCCRCLPPSPHCLPAMPAATLYLLPTSYAFYLSLSLPLLWDLFWRQMDGTGTVGCWWLVGRRACLQKDKMEHCVVWCDG